MTHILIVGIGGIGGFFGGKLSQAFKDDADIHIHFLARGSTLDTIRQNGLEVKSDVEHFITSPSTVTDSVDRLGKMDYIILCTKSYDLEETMVSIASCVDHHTVIIPLLNGVDSRQRIKRIFPENLVTDGCANIITRRTAPGYVEVFSDFKTLHFGVQGTEDERLHKLKRMFLAADIQATLTDDIWKAIWIKFIFISAAATVTSYMDKSFGQIRDEPQFWRYYSLLLNEICHLAKVKRIELPDNVKDKAIDMFHNAPYDATTSMHTDFKNNNDKNELESLCGYVVKEATAHDIAVPIYKKMYRHLSSSQMSVLYEGTFGHDKKNNN